MATQLVFGGGAERLIQVSDLTGGKKVKVTRQPTVGDHLKTYVFSPYFRLFFVSLFLSLSIWKRRSAQGKKGVEGGSAGGLQYRVIQ